MANLEY